MAKSHANRVGFHGSMTGGADLGNSVTRYPTLLACLGYPRPQVKNGNVYTNDLSVFTYINLGGRLICDCLLRERWAGQSVGSEA